MGIARLSYKADVGNIVGIRAEAYQTDLRASVIKYEFFMPVGAKTNLLQPYMFKEGVFVPTTQIDISNLYYLLNDISIYCKCILKFQYNRIVGMSLEQADLRSVQVIPISDKLGTLDISWQSVKIGELERNLMLTYFNKYIKS